MDEENKNDIQIDAAMAKQIGQIICEEIKESLSANKKTYDRAERNERMYKQVTKYEAAGKDCNTPWKNAADYYVALVEWTVDAVWSRLMNILFNHEPYMKAKGVEAQYFANQDDVTEFIDLMLREKVRIYENINYFFKQLIKLPFSVLKYEWEIDYDPMMTKEQAMTFVNPATGEKQYLLQDDPEAQMQALTFTANGYQQAPPEEVWTVQDKEIYNGPRLRYLPFKDYVWCPNAKRGYRLYWEGDRCWHTIDEMKRYKTSGKFLQAGVDAALTNIKTEGMTATAKALVERSKPLECFNWWGRLPFNKMGEIDFNDQEAIEQEVCCKVAYDSQELLQIMRWPYSKRLPFPDDSFKSSRVYIRGQYEETEDFDGRSLCDKLYKTQQQENDFVNNLFNNAWLAMQKVIIKKKQLQDEGLEEPEIYPGAILEEDATGDIRVLDMGDLRAIGFELNQMLLSFAERVSNINNWNLGNQTDKSKSTATEFAGILQEGNIGREPLLQRCYKILSEICKWTHAYYIERMPVGLERRIRGADNVPIYPTPENMPMFQQQGIKPYWSEDQIAGEFEYQWQGTSLNSDQQWNMQVANEKVGMMANPMIGGNLLVVWETLKDKYIALGEKDWQRFLPKREAVIMEMQNMAKQAQINKVKNALGQAGPGQGPGRKIMQPQPIGAGQNAGQPLS